MNYRHSLTIAGAAAGFCYWYYIGCASGTCMITSKPFNSTLYGAVMGTLIFSLFQKNKTKSDDFSGNN
ncbi:DUF6132 family protein [Sediminibacterium ginsengisoli]|nr:DUF6132 family protein [Sediminibacterium ginsengisoli]